MPLSVVTTYLVLSSSNIFSIVEQTAGYRRQIYFLSSRHILLYRRGLSFYIVEPIVFYRWARQVIPRTRFTNIDDTELRRLVELYGTDDWTMLGHIMSTNRTGRQCRDHWNLYLAPEIDHRSWTARDDKMLLE
jgi:hypothetical protein